MPSRASPTAHRRTALLLIGALLALSGAAQADEIRVGGTGSALGTLRLLGEAYTQKHPDARVIVLPSLGSSGAIKAVPTGKLDLGISSRPLTDAECADGATDREFAQTATVLAVASKSSTREITRSQIASMYRGTILNWPDGIPVRPLLRQIGDDSARQLRTLSPDVDAALQEAEKRSGLPYATTDTEAADKLESIPGAIGVTTIGQIRSENRALRPLAIDRIEPTEKNARAGTYPLLKRYYFITLPQPSMETDRFMHFVNSPAGRDILRKTGHWPP